MLIPQELQLSRKNMDELLKRCIMEESIYA